MLRWFGRAAGLAVILLAAAAVALAVVVPRLGGATPYTVLTGSMRPDLPPGTLVVTRPIDPARLGVGSVVTYQVSSGEAEVVTHRIVQQGIDASGRPVFRTQGDANNIPDPGWVEAEQVRGEQWYAVPLLGHVSTLLGGRLRQVGVEIAALLLLGYAGASFHRAWRSRDRRHVAVPRHG